jgi:copper chaperone
MQQLELKVEGMTCEHCVNAITKAVSALLGIVNVIVDLDAGLVTVEHNSDISDVAKIKAEIEDQGYDIVD